ncbi:Site-specific recombinase XerC [Halapricum desulfuricans]|uniref:Site-specific recombinase XerC n=1 Tax=Halapricum desulfuricans TaxID=2841257 RepID=A0A897NKA7_9EURY|nr:site-specific integrase [Halapricum desulfuricans]QSG11393.1 Site-specific recombinase XerC [Halapricum desulfuricans]
MTEPRTKIKHLRERIDKSDVISEADAEVLIEFSDRLDLLKSEYSDHRHEKLLRHCVRIAEEIGGLSDALEDRETAEDIVRWINREYDNEYTNHDYRTALRMLGEHTTEEEGKPASIEWIPSGTSNSHDPVPDPSDMLEWEADILPMIEQSRNSRDKALIAVAFDSGARSGELRDLTVGDVNDHEHGLQIMVDGKTGQRPVSLVPSVPYLNRWLSDHPGKDDPNAPLWSSLNKPKEITYRRFLDIFDDAARRVGVDKPVTPTNFRKSNATYLARKGMNQAFIEDRQGRKRGSDATAHYVARFGGDSDDQYAKMHGLEIEEEEDEPIGPVKCPRCDKETPRHEDRCVWCGQVLDFDAVESLQEDQRELRQSVLKLARNNPELLDDYEKARELMDLFEDNPELHEDARSFVEAMSGK